MGDQGFRATPGFHDDAAFSRSSVARQDPRFDHVQLEFIQSSRRFPSYFATSLNSISWVTGATWRDQSSAWSG